MNAAAIIRGHVNGGPKLARPSSCSPCGTPVHAIGPEPRHREGLIVEDVDIPEIVHRDIPDAAEDLPLILIQDADLKNPWLRPGDLRAHRIGSKEHARAKGHQRGPN